jgi:hypothetical protein
MKRAVLIFLSIVAVLLLIWSVDRALAAAYPPALGGTGTTASPAAGQVLVGTGSGAYTPAYILCAGTCSVSSASGTVTITGTGVSTTTGNWQGTWQLYNPSDFLPSSTQYVSSVNGGSGTVTITSSTLGVVWPTVNGNKAAAYQITAGTGATTTVSGATTTISVSLNNGVTQTCSANQFVNSVTSAGIASCGSITFPTAPTYTSVAGSGISITQATSSTNTTTTITNTGVTSTAGNWQGTWQGTNSTTYYLATNPSGYISSALQNASVTATSPITWSAASVIGCASCLTTSTASTTYVPYIGANSNVNLGSNNLAVGGSLNITSTLNVAGTSTFASTTFSGNISSTASMAFLNGYAPLMYNASGHDFSWSYNSNGGIYLSGDLLGSTYAYFTASGWVFNTNVAVDNSTAFPPTNYGFAVGQGKASVFSGEVDIGTSATSSVLEGDKLHVVGNADVTGNLAVGTTTTGTATLNVVSATTSVATFAESATATSTVTIGTASSSACLATYTASGTPIYSTYYSTGQILTSTSHC